MKKRWVRGLLLLLCGFLLFFVFRLIYGFVYYPDNSEEQQQTNYMNLVNQSNMDEGQTLSLRKNYASYKQKSNVQESISVDQKYEKKATMNSYSSKYDEDVDKIKNIIDKNNALIQYENRSGLDGNRNLFLSIGVPPDNFDIMVEEIKKIGRLNYIQINKNDKTNEYKELNAKIKSLVKSRDALINLKNMQAKVEELIQLEEKILVLENQIQDLGVNLGQYDAENEFCTVDFTLKENIFKGQKIGIMQRLLVGLEWTVKSYALFIFTFLMGFLLLLVIFKLLEKLKIIKSILDKLDKGQ